MSRRTSLSRQNSMSSRRSSGASKRNSIDPRPWNNLQTSASTKTTTMTTAAKLYGKDLSEYDDVDVDELLSQLTPEEINILAKEVDPDVSGYIKFIKIFFESILLKGIVKWICCSFRTVLCHPRNVAVTSATKALRGL